MCIVCVYTCDIDGLASTVIAFVNQIKLICANAPSRVLLFTMSVKVGEKGGGRGACLISMHSRKKRERVFIAG